MTEKAIKKADIVGVANAARVSPATVSRFFNRPELVKPQTRKRIDKAVKKLGYIRNRAAQTIHGIRSGTIGLVVPTIDHAIFAEVIQAFSDAVGEKGFTILLGSHGYAAKREYEILRKFLEQRVDGVALVGLEHSEEVFQLIESQDIPSLLLWNYSAVSRLPCVGADNFEAGRKIASHVLAQGHRSVATLFPPLAGNDRATSRFKGVMQALQQAGVVCPTEWMLETPYSISAAKRAIVALLSAGNRPGAIIGGNDVLALGAVYGAQSFGLRIPLDIAITGIGDFKGSREVEPAITTVRIPAKQIGAAGGLALAQAITVPEFLIENECCASEVIRRATG